MGIIPALAMCIGLAVWASKKGFNPVLWFFSGGLLGVVVLALMPSANAPDISLEVADSRRRNGNIAGGIIVGIVALAVVFFVAVAR
jgi:hypothetical protein